MLLLKNIIYTIFKISIFLIFNILFITCNHLNELPHDSLSDVPSDFEDHLKALPHTVKAFENTFAPLATMDVRDAYTHQTTSGYCNTDWMSNIRDDAPIHKLSIPGTHDTMALHGGDRLQTQSLPLSEQLNSGIRVIDIRVGIQNNRLEIYHVIDQKAEFEKDVLQVVINFLDRHPGETILMRLGSSRAPGDPHLLDEKFSDCKAKYASYFWEPTNDTPTLDAVRKKIVLLQGFPSNQPQGLDYKNSCGLNYKPQSTHPLFNIQSEYKLVTMWGLHHKWHLVKKQIAIASTIGKNIFCMNYLSGSACVCPYFVASGYTHPDDDAKASSTDIPVICKHKYPDFPRGKYMIHFQGTNLLTLRFLKANPHIGSLGIMMVDFPGKGLIEQIISCN